MDQNINIDIHIPKLLQWLVSRRHCQHEWQKEVVKIRNKINTALEDMPENEAIVKIISGSYINYFHCVRIVEVLKETEADSKNIFGRYSSKRMKDWNEILSMYSKNNIYLAEAADLLTNMVKYDIPGLRRQVLKQQQLQTEYKKKSADSLKSTGILKNELNLFLRELGLEGKTSGYRRELVLSAKDLPTLHEEIATATRTVLPAVQHYLTFAKYTQPSLQIDMDVIKYIAEKGNTTAYEWIHGEPPTRVVLPPSLAEEEEDKETDNGDEIDWGVSEYTGDIQIEVVDSGVEAAEAAGEPPAEESSDPNEKLAQGPEALSVLDNLDTRRKFANELLEVKAFLKARLLEDTVENNLETVSEPRNVVETMINTLEAVLKLLNSPTIQHYFKITHSPKYLDGIVEKIQLKLDAIERAHAVAEAYTERAKDSVEEVTKINLRVQSLLEKSKELQSQIAKDISQRYNGRRVNLVGGAM